MFPRIKNILDVTPFNIKCEWTNGEIRTIDFTLLQQHLSSQTIKTILQPEIFNQVKIDPVSKTLSWDNQLAYQDYDGVQRMGALDFCPDVLYQNSI